ncbi:winged helix-turn-helix domain-containing protein [Nonomuraea lactucae]|uniref:winged helix-turn-helix domain-containing protein n=1 Tax=Nonomuraea lactucae TaxID=2249762 RepID=UPI000DE3313D|nr:winged helix-turn-helix domain-containing protein [Nonomuraea lactucae]
MIDPREDSASADTPGRRVAAAVSDGIKTQRWKPGEQLPTEPEMQAEYGVGRSAVRSALRQLREQGTVVTVPCVGTFVADRRAKAKPPMPASQRLVADIREQITSGRLKPGDQLPRESELIDTYGVSSALIRSSLRTLREEGLIYSRGREGRFVGPRSAPRRRPPTLTERVAAAVAERIQAGEFGPDEMLPSEAELERQYAVSKLTVRAAAALLREQGWAYTVPHRGTFVAPRDRWPQPTSTARA